MNPSRDLIDRMVAYEAGDLSWDETIALFQELIDSGDVWMLQGYGRSATMLIEGGYCHSAAGELDPEGGCVHLWSDDETCYRCLARKRR
jgi:hypothetical protein